MAATWPASIQQLLDASYTETDVTRMIKTEVEAGPVKARTIYTKRRRRATCAILCDINDYITFSNFFDITLAGGTLDFDFKHPLTGDVLTFIFEEPPTYTFEGPIYMRATMTWVEK